MWNDPIVEEVRQHREAYAARFNFDLSEICRDLRARQEKSSRQVVSLSPRRVEELVEAGDKPAA